MARLLFVSEHGGPSLELDALRLAADLLKQGVDTATYASVRAVIAAGRRGGGGERRAGGPH